MAEADWTYLNDGLDIATVDRGVTAGITRPPGGGFLYAFNSLAAVNGAVALFANLASFAPRAKGGAIRGVLQRGPGGGPTGFSPFLFLCRQGNSVNDRAYLLGLSDDDPHRIVLARGRSRGPAHGGRARCGAQIRGVIRASDVAAPPDRRYREHERQRGAQGLPERPRAAPARHASRLAACLRDGRVHRRPPRHQRGQPAAHLGARRLRLSP